MRRLIATLLLAAGLALPGPGLRAQDVAGRFDYYVLALSWSPNWCAIQGDARDAAQCRDDSGQGWVLHGLWPQYEFGWPAECDNRHAPPSRAQARAMADIMGSAALARHQWRRHGTCAGIAPDAYFALSRAAYARVTTPALLRQLDRTVTLPARLIEEAFLRDNPDLAPDGITITCRDGHIQEARICLTRDLEFRDCGADVRRDCSLNDAIFTPLR